MKSPSSCTKTRGCLRDPRHVAMGEPCITSMREYVALWSRVAAEAWFDKLDAAVARVNGRRNG